MSNTICYQRNRDVILNRAKDYYENDKERLREQARDKYRNLSEEDKNEKRKYGRNRYHNMPEEKKHLTKFGMKACFISLNLWVSQENYTTSLKTIFQVDFKELF